MHCLFLSESLPTCPNLQNFGTARAVPASTIEIFQQIFQLQIRVWSRKQFTFQKVTSFQLEFEAANNRGKEIDSHVQFQILFWPRNEVAEARQSVRAMNYSQQTICNVHQKSVLLFTSSKRCTVEMSYVLGNYHTVVTLSVKISRI